jgi:ribosome maturation factor RimP
MSKRFSREELTEKFTAFAHAVGSDLYDIEFPTLDASTLRVFIFKPTAVKIANAREGVTVEQCAKVSRSILDWLEAEQVAGFEEWSVEVSSPGINRKLRTIEHFQSAIGERVSVSLEDGSSSARKNFLGVVNSVSGQNIVLEIESKAGAKTKKKRSPSQAKTESAKEKLNIDLKSIADAQVDFDFD